MKKSYQIQFSRYGNERKTNGSNFHFLYSTPSCYLKALKDASQTWPTYAEDFFPYASGEDKIPLILLPR